VELWSLGLPVGLRAHARKGQTGIAHAQVNIEIIGADALMSWDDESLTVTPSTPWLFMFLFLLLIVLAWTQVTMPEADDGSLQKLLNGSHSNSMAPH
jgi:hypothetical protein